MEITEVFYPEVRQEWRSWLETYHQTKTEIWLRRYRKATGKPSISYDDMVEECLCFGWIDGLVKKDEPESYVQRITPRKENSFLSELNRQRVWKLQRLGLMTPAGLSAVEDQLGSPDDPLEIPGWVLQQLQDDPVVWENFQGFSHFYKRLKISWIGELQDRRRQEAQKRLDYLIKMTRQGKKYGTIPLED